MSYWDVGQDEFQETFGSCGGYFEEKSRKIREIQEINLKKKKKI